MSQLTIRKYQPADRETLIDLWTIVFPDHPPHNEPEKVIDTKLAVDDLIFVATLGDRIVGACIAGYDGFRGWLYFVAVHPQCRRGGIGTGLVTHAMACLKELGCTKVNLQIRAANEAVAAFYKALGFAAEDRISMGAHTERY